MRVTRMYLHEAMKVVLGERPGHRARTSELSEAIGTRKLYLRKDGKTASASQINAGAKRYDKLFQFVEPGLVRLVSGR